MCFSVQQVIQNQQVDPAYMGPHGATAALSAVMPLYVVSLSRHQSKRLNNRLQGSIEGIASGMQGFAAVKVG